MSNRTDVTNDSQNGILSQITPRCDLGSCRFCLPSGKCSVSDQRSGWFRVLLLVMVLSDPEDVKWIMDHLEEVREELGS